MQAAGVGKGCRSYLGPVDLPVPGGWARAHDGHPALLCVSAAQMFPPGPVLPAGATSPAPGVGNATLSALAANRASIPLANLVSQTAYVVCIIAEDAWLNRQAAPTVVGFTTLDITPPLLALAVQAGTDGQVTCDR